MVLREGLRERKRQATQRRIVDHALRLFVERGFEATTVDDIAAAADVARRTFFRYFERKEDVALAWLDAAGEALLGSIVERPDDESPLDVAREALLGLVDVYRDHVEEALAVVQLITDAPSIRAREREKQAEWEDAITAHFAGRLGVDATKDVRPRLVAALTLAVLNASVAIWRAQRGRPHLASVVEDAFGALADESRAVA
jgi:AcrR family transcriptional regulator